MLASDYGENALFYDICSGTMSCIMSFKMRVPTQRKLRVGGCMKNRLSCSVTTWRCRTLVLNRRRGFTTAKAAHMLSTAPPLRGPKRAAS